VALWLLAYFATGQLLVPFVLSLCGIERGDLSFPDKAILHLLLDLWELAVTVVVLWRCLAKYKPREKGFFPLRWEGARWVPWLLAGMLSFPLVDWLAHESLIWVNGPDGYAELGYAELEATLHSGDWGTVMAYLVVVAACAPAWEELIFRGFLLASLSKYLPGGWAVVSNSLLFALCHFRLETLAPLFVLGLVFGGVYVRTNNLVPSILLHSLWNVYVVATMVLRSYGWKWWWVPSAFC
jgi:membrane protease YdiL (CAAX protease family)